MVMKKDNPISNRTLLAVIVLIAFFTPGCAMSLKPSVTLPPGQTQVKIPLEFGRGYLFTRAKVNGQDAGYFLVDTGAAATILDDDLFKHLGLPARGGIAVSGFGGMKVSGTSSVRSIVLGDVKLGRHSVIVTDLDELFEPFGFKVNGVLGYSLFQGLPFTIDYREPSLIMYARTHFQPPTDAFGARMILLNGQPHVTGRINKKYEGLLCIDTGNPRPLTLNTPFVSGHPDLLPATTIKTESSGFGGNVEVTRGKLDSLDIFGQSFRQVETEFVFGSQNLLEAAPQSLFGTERDGDNLGTLGAVTLRDFRLTFDYRREQLWAQWRPREPLKIALKRFMNVNKTDISGFTPLMNATVEGRNEDVKTLISAGADVNTKAKAKTGLTALILAVAYVRPAILKTLIDNSANVNACNKDGNTALMAAAKKGNEEILRMLIAAGANINARNHTDNTALIYATYNGNAQIASILLSKGADPNHKNQYGWTPLIAAAGGGNEATISVLLAAGSQVDAKNSYGNTALIVAAGLGHWRNVESLLKAGADISARNDDDETPLIVAANSANDSTIRCLIAHMFDMYRFFGIGRPGEGKSKAPPSNLTYVPNVVKASDSLLHVGPLKPGAASAGLLIALAKRVRTRKHHACEIQASLLEAVGASGDKRAIPLLIKFLKETNAFSSFPDSDDNVRNQRSVSDAALFSLIRITDQDYRDYGINFSFYGKPVWYGFDPAFDTQIPHFGFPDEKSRKAAIKKFKTWWKRHKTDPPYRDLKPLEIPKLP